VYANYCTTIQGAILEDDNEYQQGEGTGDDSDIIGLEIDVDTKQEVS
jgi:hypothetical protein